MKIRKAEADDLANILCIYKAAREFMRQTGNPDQWNTTHPARSILEDDIAKGQLYVLEDGDGLQGVFALITGLDPTYGYIEGQWLNNESYVTIHRIASSGKKSGILPCAVQYGLSLCNNLRIDTHHDNKVMQHLLTKNGFSKCGIIYLENGDPRIAYQICK